MFLQYLQHQFLLVRHLLLLLRVCTGSSGADRGEDDGDFTAADRRENRWDCRNRDYPGHQNFREFRNRFFSVGAPPEFVEVVELGPPVSAESAPPIFVMAHMVEAALFVVEYVQPAQVWNIVADNLTDEEFAQALVPLDSAISQHLGCLKLMNDQVSFHERTLEQRRCQLFSWVLNRCTKQERRQLENDYASVSNMILCERDKIAEIKSGLSSALRQRQCLPDHWALQYPDHSRRRRLTEWFLLVAQRPVWFRTWMWTVRDGIISVGAWHPFVGASQTRLSVHVYGDVAALLLRWSGLRFCERARWRLVGGTQSDSSVVWEEHERMRCESNWRGWFSVRLRRSWKREFASIMSTARAGFNRLRTPMHDERVIAVQSSIHILSFQTRCHRWIAVT